MLNAKQQRDFREQGYLVLEDAFTSAQIDAVRQSALEIVANFDSDAHRTVFKTSDRDAGRDDYFFDSAEAVHCFLEEGALDESGEMLRPKELAINKIGHAMHDLVPAFTEFCRLPVIAESLRDIGYTEPSLWQTMYIFKQPGIGGEVRWHQDASYLVSEPPDVTGIWIAIEDAGLENGCLWVQPGGHRSPLREIFEVDWERRKGTLRELDDTPWPGPEEAVPLEVNKGAMVLFSDHMPHYSSQNRSNRSRHALTLHVTERGAHWPEFNWLQRPRLGEFLL